MLGQWVLIGKHIQKPIKPTPTYYEEKEVDEKPKNKHRIRFRGLTRT